MTVQSRILNGTSVVRGAIPGPKGGLVLIRTAAKAPVSKGGAK